MNVLPGRLQVGDVVVCRRGAEGHVLADTGIEAGGRRGTGSLPGNEHPCPTAGLTRVDRDGDLTVVVGLNLYGREWAVDLHPPLHPPRPSAPGRTSETWASSPPPSPASHHPAPHRPAGRQRQVGARRGGAPPGGCPDRRSQGSSSPCGG